MLSTAERPGGRRRPPMNAYRPKDHAVARRCLPPMAGALEWIAFGVLLLGMGLPALVPRTDAGSVELRPVADLRTAGGAMSAPVRLRPAPRIHPRVVIEAEAVDPMGAATAAADTVAPLPVVPVVSLQTLGSMVEPRR